MHLPRPRFTVRRLMIAVAVAAVFFAVFRLSSDVVYRVFLSLSFLAIISSGLVAASRPRRLNLWSIVLLAIGVIALVLAVVVHALGNRPRIPERSCSVGSATATLRGQG